MLASSVPKPGDGSEPFFPGRRAPFHAPDNRVAHRVNSDEPQKVAIEALEAMGAEEEPIDGRGHSHRHDDPRGSTGEKLGRRSDRTLLDRKTGAHDLFEKTLEEGRNVSEP